MHQPYKNINIIGNLQEVFPKALQIMHFNKLIIKWSLIKNKPHYHVPVHQLIRKCPKSSTFSHYLANDKWSTYGEDKREAVCMGCMYMLGLGLFFDPQGGSDMFLQKVGLLSTDYTTLYPRRQNSYKHCCENLKSCKRFLSNKSFCV